MNKHPSIKLARKAFDKLSQVFYSKMTNEAEVLLDMCKAEEKAHRGWGPDFYEHHTADTATVADCAHLFAVLRVAEYLNLEIPNLENKRAFPMGKDFIHMQKSCFQAAANCRLNFVMK